MRQAFSKAVLRITGGAVLATVCHSFAQVDTADQTVIADGGVEISRVEFEEILKSAPPRVVERATTDLGDRLEFINSLLVNRRLAADADVYTVGDDGYWELYFALIATKQKFIFERLLKSVETPDLGPLTEERYETQKDKYALVAEQRASSHILLASQPGDDREDVRSEAFRILSELKAGADWNEYVTEYSDDSGSRERNGALSRSVSFGDPGITPPYTEALFAIEDVGGYSEVTDTQFGVHIIRLDGIEEAYYRRYEEVRQTIRADIEREFKQAAARVIRARYNLTDNVFIDGEAMDELFAPYMAQ